jgi:hypothetical protein
MVSGAPSVYGNAHTMVVFIHGTLFPIPSFHILGSSLHLFLSKGRRLKKSWYQNYLDQVKFHGFYKQQVVGADGLIKIHNNQKKNKKLSPYSLYGAKLYKEIGNYISPEGYKHCSCYAFGWDGRLSKSKRLRWGRELYTSLEQESSRLKREKNVSDIKIILVTHSHGGNVALNLVSAHKEFKKNLSIDTLVLLGTPVQSETELYAHDDFFKRVYNIYSRGDVVQVLDIISTDDSRSHRCFVPHIDDPVRHLVQIEIQIGDKRPSHSELWLFGNEEGYVCRKSLATFPLPVVLFVPAIIASASKMNTTNNDLVVKIDHQGDNYTVACCERKKGLGSLHDFNNYVVIPGQKIQKELCSFLPK